MKHIYTNSYPTGDLCETTLEWHNTKQNPRHIPHQIPILFAKLSKPARMYSLRHYIILQSMVRPWPIQYPQSRSTCIAQQQGVTVSSASGSFRVGPNPQWYWCLCEVWCTMHWSGELDRVCLKEINWTTLWPPENLTCPPQGYQDDALYGGSAWRWGLYQVWHSWRKFGGRGCWWWWARGQVVIKSGAVWRCCTTWCIGRFYQTAVRNSMACTDAERVIKQCGVV